MKRSSLIVIDLAGACIVTSCVGALVWMVLLRDNEAGKQAADLRDSVSTLRKDLGALRGTLDEQQARVAKQKEELAERGALPERTPIEAELNQLSQLARSSSIDILAVSPLPEQTYPGLLELRYSIQITGRMPDIAQFFRAIEAAPMWADVSYMHIDEGGNRSQEPGSQPRLATLTMSFFSAADDLPDSPGDPSNG
jgi:Tfp pilus assembly protein PilO